MCIRVEEKFNRILIYIRLYIKLVLLRNNLRHGKSKIGIIEGRLIEGLLYINYFNCLDFAICICFKCNSCPISGIIDICKVNLMSNNIRYLRLFNTNL